jgi:hypothetical protein
LIHLAHTAGAEPVTDAVMLNSRPYQRIHDVPNSHGPKLEM